MNVIGPLIIGVVGALASYKVAEEVFGSKFSFAMIIVISIGWAAIVAIIVSLGIIAEKLP